MVDTSGLDGPEQDLVSQVVAACQAAIDSAMANPAGAVSLAAGLNSALSTLTLVQTEAGKGAAGLQPVVANADALTRAALEDVLKWAPNPLAAAGALAGVDRVAPKRARDTEPARPIAAPVNGVRSQPQRGRGLSDLRRGLAGVYRDAARTGRRRELGYRLAPYAPADVHRVDR